MSQIDNQNLEFGFKAYDAKIKNIEGIFTKLKIVPFDVSEYEKDLESIKQEVKNDSNFSNKMLDGMLDNYIDMVFTKYAERLDDLAKTIENNYRPFYELYLLYSNIGLQIATITCENIGDIIENTKHLIDTINSLNARNIKEKNYLIEEAYKIVYQVIMYEELFNRSDIFSYINKLNNTANKENIGRLLANDLEKLSKHELFEEDLRTIKTEGLGYDYLNEDIIRKVSRNTVGEANSEYQERKRQAIDEIATKIKYVSNRKNSLLSELRINKNVIRNFYLKKSLLATKALSMILVPIITFSAGHMIGKKASEKIIEYKTVTQTVDLNTGEIIGEPSVVYDEKETTYVATIMVYSPWRKNPIGSGYTSNVVAYEYKVPDNISEDYHVTSKDLSTDSLLEKYSYEDRKNILEDGDSTIESTILITETFQDKNVSQKSSKYIIPGSIAGALTGIGLDVILFLFVIHGFKEAASLLDSLNYNIRERKLSNKDIQNRLLSMKDEIVGIQQEYNDVVKKYGSLGDMLVIPEIDSSWILDDSMKRARKK